MFRIYLIILNIEKQLGNAVKRRQAFNQRFLKRLFLLRSCKIDFFHYNGRHV